MKTDPNFSYSAFIYEDHLTPTGLLPREKKKEASAAWHFTRLAMVILQKIPEQVSYEGNTDLTVPLMRIAESVAVQYGIKHENFLCFMDFVRAEAFRCAMPWNDRLQAWVESGGKSYNFVTREEGALNKQ